MTSSNNDTGRDSEQASAPSQNQPGVQDVSCGCAGARMHVNPATAVGCGVADVQVGVAVFKSAGNEPS